MSELLDRIGRAVTLESSDAAVRIHAQYSPQGGPTSKIFPPTYVANAEGDRYHFEPRWDANGDKVDVVIVDSVQSQAARAESALIDHLDRLGLPVLATEASVTDEDTGEVRSFRITNLDAPHRSRDAYFIDSELDGVKFDKTEVGQALLSGTSHDPTPYLLYAPTDLVFGVWDSHRGKRIPTKFARAYTSEMVGWHVLRGKKAATKTDPNVLKGKSKVPLDVWRPDLETNNKKNTEEKLSELGYGMVPVAPSEDVGGVSVRSITRTAVVSLTSLARYRFPSAGNLDTEARSTLAALALVADRLAFAAPGLHLRSGTDLVLESETVEWVQAGGRTEPFELDRAAALALFLEARDRLASAGVAWDPTPIVLTPAPHLADAIAETYLARTLDEAE